MPETHCPTCGCDVKGCDETIEDGARRWTQPVTKSEKANGAAIYLGGLTHVEGGRRCLMDARDRVVPA